MSNTTYSNRSNTLRAVKTAGYNKEDVVVEQDEAGRFYFEATETEAVDPAVNAALTAQYGFHTCPECSTSLDNGVCGFEGVMEAQDQTTTPAQRFAAAYKIQGQEFACFVCDYEWGQDASVFDPSKTAVAHRTYKQSGEFAYAPSKPESPVAAVWGLYDSLMAKSEPLVRKNYIAEARGMEMNPNTASAQFNSWKKARGH